MSPDRHVPTKLSMIYHVVSVRRTSLSAANVSNYVHVVVRHRELYPWPQGKAGEGTTCLYCGETIYFAYANPSSLSASPRVVFGTTNTKMRATKVKTSIRVCDNNTKGRNPVPLVMVVRCWAEGECDWRIP